MTGGFVIIVAHVAIGVPVLGAEELTALAPKSSQPYLPPATEAPVHLSLHLRSKSKTEPLRSNSIWCCHCRRNNILAWHLRSHSRFEQTRTRSMMNLQQLDHRRRRHRCNGCHCCWWWSVCCCCRVCVCVCCGRCCCWNSRCWSSFGTCSGYCGNFACLSFVVLNFLKKRTNIIYIIGL